MIEGTPDIFIVCVSFIHENCYGYVIVTTTSCVGKARMYLAIFSKAGELGNRGSASIMSLKILVIRRTLQTDDGFESSENQRTRAPNREQAEDKFRHHFHSTGVVIQDRKWSVGLRMTVSIYGLLLQTFCQRDRGKHRRTIETGTIEGERLI